MSTEILITLAGIGLLTILAQWAAWVVRLPAILFLLLAGIVAGPLVGWLKPDQLFGDLLFPLVSLAVAVILFEGSMTLKFEELRGIGSTVRNLVSIGALITWLVTSVTVYYTIDFDPKLALLFGAMVIVTGPTVITPMLRSVRPNSRIADVLRWEGIVIDPLGALLAVLAFDFYVSTESRTALGSIGLLFGQIAVLGTLLGIVAGFSLGQLLKRYLIPEHLRSVITLLLVFVVFTVAEALQHEAGLLAVTVFGITLANLKGVEIDDILDFKESLSILLISGLFIILAARVDLNALLALGYGSVIVLLSVMLLARPAAVFVSTAGSSLTIRERLLIAWIGPRGIVCAAVAAVFALRLEEMGRPEADLFVPLAFLIIIGTVVVQSASAKYIAHWLDVRDPAPRGVMIVGAGSVARTIAAVLDELEVKVLLVDSSWENIRQARMRGLDTFYGNPVSEHADRHLDLSGIGKMFAISGRTNFDTLAAMTFRPVFGPPNIFELPASADMVASDVHGISSRYRGRHLFHELATWQKVASWLRQGAEIKTTGLTEEYDFERYKEAYGDRLLILFAIDASGKLQIFTSDRDLEPGADWKLVSLILPEGSSIKDE